MTIQTPAHRRREGFALPMALLTTVIMGVLVTAAFYSVAVEARTSVRGTLGSQAMFVAERGLEAAVIAWHEAALLGLEADTTFDPVAVIGDGQRRIGTYRLSIQRVGPGLYLVSSEGRVRSGLRSARRDVATLLRASVPALRRDSTGDPGSGSSMGSSPGLADPATRAGRS